MISDKKYQDLYQQMHESTQVRPVAMARIIEENALLTELNRRGCKISLRSPSTKPAVTEFESILATLILQP
jgi:hypothetical protein